MRGEIEEGCTQTERVVTTIGICPHGNRFWASLMVLRVVEEELRNHRYARWESCVITECKPFAVFRPSKHDIFAFGGMVNERSLRFWCNLRVFATFSVQELVHTTTPAVFAHDDSRK
jgi:hypothetical protein